MHWNRTLVLNYEIDVLSTKLILAGTISVPSCIHLSTTDQMLTIWPIRKKKIYDLVLAIWSLQDCKLLVCYKSLFASILRYVWLYWDVQCRLISISRFRRFTTNVFHNLLFKKHNLKMICLKSHFIMIWNIRG